MNAPKPRVVLDTVVLLQALLSPSGPAAACIEELRAGRFVLLFSVATRYEAANVTLRPRLTRRFSQLTPDRVNVFLEDLDSRAVLLSSPPHAFDLARDRKDEPLVDLAVAAGAQYLVTWDEHLLHLARKDTEEGTRFSARFPNIAILTPPAFLRTIRSDPT